MLGRLLAARLLKSVGKEQLVFASGVGAFLGGAILLAAHSGAMLVVGVLVMGISYAGIFPTALAIAGDAYRRMVGTVFGLLFAIALVGGMTFPWAVGHISQTAGIRYGMAVPMLGALVICGLAWKIHMSKRKEVLREEPEPNGTATRGRR
jgi:fucose permease